MENNHTTIQKIKNYLSDLWFRYVKKPFYYGLIVEPRLKREEAIRIAKLKEEEDIRIAKLKEDFEVKQKVSVERFKEIMSYYKVYHENTPKLEYRNQKLVEGRKHVIDFGTYMSERKITPSFFYEPEICDIHNENLNSSNKTLHEIMSREHNLAEAALENQTKNLNSSNKTLHEIMSREHNLAEAALENQTKNIGRFSTAAPRKTFPDTTSLNQFEFLKGVKK